MFLWEFISLGIFHVLQLQQVIINFKGWDLWVWRILIYNYNNKGS